MWRISGLVLIVQASVGEVPKDLADIAPAPSATQAQFGLLQQNPLLSGWLDHIESLPLHLLQEVPVEPPAQDGSYAFEQHWFTPELDHVNKQNVGKFKLRYFVYDKFSRSEQKYPLFVYCGAEQGDINQEWERMGFMLEVARSHGAKVLWLEHRFFGQSIPFGADAFLARSDRVGLLSLEQSLADYAAIIRLHKREGPVLTFGGSLSGTIAAILRIQYPALVDMAFASSAPILGVDGVADQFAWRKRMTDNFVVLGDKDCPGHVRRGFAAFAALSAGDAAAAKEAARQLQVAFRTCEKNPTKKQLQLLYHASWAELERLGNFVYPANASGIPRACERMAQASSPEVFARLLNMDGTGSASGKCLNLTSLEGRSNAGAHIGLGWSYLACTEVVHPIGANSKTDMFPAYNWSVEALSQTCQHSWRVTPDASYIRHKIAVGIQGFGESARVMKSSAVPGKILFTWGEFDPWGTMVPKEGWADDVKVIHVPGGSHCSDLESARLHDTAEMKDARRQIASVLAEWLGGQMKVDSFGHSLPVRNSSIRSFGVAAEHAGATDAAEASFFQGSRRSTAGFGGLRGTQLASAAF